MVLWFLRVCLGNFGVQHRHCWQSEKNRRDQTPENSDRARDAKTGKGRVARKSERTKTADRGQTCEENRLHYTGNIMLESSIVTRESGIITVAADFITPMKFGGSMTRNAVKPHMRFTINSPCGTVRPWQCHRQ